MPLPPLRGKEAIAGGLLFLDLPFFCAVTSGLPESLMENMVVFKGRSFDYGPKSICGTKWNFLIG